MLLPLPAATTEKMSLQFHLALAACRKAGNGNSYQFNDLLRALYITHHLQEMGFGSLPMQVFACAEFGMNAALSKRKQNQAWFVDARTASLLEQILALHDCQLGAIRMKDLTAAIEQLERFIRSQRASPLSDELRAEARKLAAEWPSEAE
ncbi:Fis family transcriptional regulator (plasmid) [Caballeronia sp. S22]